MKKKVCLRCAALGLALCLMLGVIGNVPLRAADAEPAQALAQPLRTGSEQMRRPASDERVRIIVELEDAPILEAAKASIQSFRSTGEFFRSSAAASAEQALTRSRKAVKSRILQKDLDVEIRWEYSAVFNGFSADASYGDLASIRAIPGVKDVFLSEYYTLDAEDQTSGASGLSATGPDAAAALEYTGKGTAVAILDTGMDVSHEAFSAVEQAKFTRQDIQSVLQNEHLTAGGASVNALYKSEKIPFAYDYADMDTDVADSGSHGTHVAGIIGANAGGVIQGVAPDAQLLIMKIFSDTDPGAYQSDMLAALEDAVKLGVDVINMSVGFFSGFSKSSSQSMQQVYDRISDAGIGLYCAAGNYYSSTRGNLAGNNLPKATEPDNGVACAPSTYDAAISVASANNTSSPAPYFLVGEKKIRFNDARDGELQFTTALRGEYEYVDCGVGSTADFAGKNLTQKIALVRRGGEENGASLTFVQKEANAYNAGAAALVVYDNVDGTLISMHTENLIPGVFISKADGEFLCAAAQKKLTIDPEFTAQFTDQNSGKLSDFSSWGATLDLKLKPEITAPGGDIYSSVPGSLYDYKSGTSMASPYLAGAGIVMEQYLRQTDPALSAADRTAIANALMMSTAQPVRDLQGIYYSPRKQGAGALQLDRAISSDVYLTNPDGSRPKGELGAADDGNFSFAFKLNQLTGKTTAYTTSVTVLTEDTVVDGGVTYMAQAARELTGDEVIVQIPATVDSSQQVRVTVSLTDRGKENLKRDFPNGIFLEGYVTLTPQGDGVPLSYPFMGFYGDWESLPVFDSTLYDDRAASMYETYLSLYDSFLDEEHALGCNLYLDDADTFDAEKIAIPGGDSSIYLTAYCSLLRNVDSLEFSAQTSDGVEVYSESISNATKNYAEDDAYNLQSAETGWSPVDGLGNPLPDGSYLYRVTGVVGDSRQTLTFPVEIDSEPPRVIESKTDGSTLTVTVQDNHYIQALCATAIGTYPLTELIEPEAEEAGACVDVRFDLTDSVFNGRSRVRIYMIDYAGNETLSDYIVLDPSATPNPPTVAEVKDAIKALPEHVTEADRTAIEAAREAYDALLPAQKIAVGEELLEKLEAAEAALAALTQDTAAAKAVEAQVNAIGEVTKDSGPQIEAARAAYDALSDAQKQLLSAAVLQKLEDAEKAYADLIASMKPVFSDVPADSWYREYVDDAAELGLIQGNNGNFSPMDQVKRCDFVTILGRYEGVQDSSAAAPVPTIFQDVPAAKYYASHVAWATENGVTTGLTDTIFGIEPGSGKTPKNLVTREQAVTFLYRYAQKKGIGLPEADAARFPDDDSISPYARQAVYAMKAAGIIEGRTTGNFDPKGSTTRAEAVKMIVLLLKM